MKLFFDPVSRDQKDHTFSFPVQCVALKILGVWPLHPSVYSDKNVRQQFLAFLYLLWSYIAITIIGVTCVMQGAYVVVAWGDILTVTECGSTVMMGFHTLCRLIHMNTHRRKMSRLNEIFVRDVWISRKESEIVAAHCAHDSLVYKMVSGLLFALISAYVFVPLLEIFTNPDLEELPFPYKMVFPYDASQMPAYAITYAGTSLAGFGALTTLLSEDSYFGFFLSHCCGRFRLLHMAIDQMGDERLYAGKISQKRQGLGMVYPDDDGGRRSRMTLKRIIAQHNTIIEFGKELESFFAPMLLLNFTIISFLICSTLFQIAVSQKTLGNMTKLLMFFTSALIQLFLICWNGNRLIVKSEETKDHLYNCNWHIPSPASSTCVSLHQDVAFVKDVSLAILRSQRPVRLTAMKFSVLSLGSLSAILSTSMSYFTLLQSMIDKK